MTTRATEVFQEIYTEHFIVRDEDVALQDSGCAEEHVPYRQQNCYTFDEQWIGDLLMALFLQNDYGITHFQKGEPDHCVCSVGYSPRHRKWFGWSHRTIRGFGINDSMYVAPTKENPTPDPFEDGTITTMTEAKESADRFAEDVL